MKAVILFVCSFSMALVSITSAQDFHTEVQSVFNFSPRLLSKQQQTERIKSLDTLFEKVLKDTARYLPLLRAELQRNDNPKYFYYDGAILLTEASHTPADSLMFLASLQKTDVQDLSPRIYVQLLNKYARNGYNVTGAALKILEDSVFHVFIPQHAMTLEKPECLGYMLLPLQPTMYVDSLINHLNKETEKMNVRALTLLLWLSCSCKADSALHDYNIGAHSRQDVQSALRMIVHQVLKAQAMSGIGTGAKTKENDEAMKMFIEDLKKGGDTAHLKEALLMMKMMKGDASITLEETEEIRASNLSSFSDESWDMILLATSEMKKKPCRK